MSLPGGVSADDRATVALRVTWAVERLKDKFPLGESEAELERNCWGGIQETTPEMRQFWNIWLRKHPKLNHDDASKTFTFRPLHNISSADTLLKFLRTQKAADGLQVKDLKDGWKDCEAIIDDLEHEHKILISRNKKDSKARVVWADSPDCYAEIDPEFRDAWRQISLGTPEETIKELVKGGYKSAGAIKAQPVIAQTQKKKPRAIRQGKTTNSHMKGVFKDYSHKRAQAGK